MGGGTVFFLYRFGASVCGNCMACQVADTHLQFLSSAGFILLHSTVSGCSLGLQ
jgi:hypothetical protein